MLFHNVLIQQYQLLQSEPLVLASDLDKASYLMTLLCITNVLHHNLLITASLVRTCSSLC
jgi:hypothetical protein